MFERNWLEFKYFHVFAHHIDFNDNINNELKVNNKVLSVKAVKACKFVRHRGSHILLKNRKTDGEEVVSFTPYLSFNLRKNPGIHF
jgi:hypothetical protein